MILSKTIKRVSLKEAKPNMINKVNSFCGETFNIAPSLGFFNYFGIDNIRQTHETDMVPSFNLH
ncbi:hypothetical protein Q5O89_12810 [Peribacillus frigoritolerans]|nr:hypothetical protein [Peribacillus frigoritolerans]